jgi:hypothetical protein
VRIVLHCWAKRYCGAAGLGVVRCGHNMQAHFNAQLPVSLPPVEEHTTDHDTVTLDEGSASNMNWDYLIGGPSIKHDTRTFRMEETTLGRAAMGRLAKALVFICGPDHPTTVALQAAAESGSERDIKNARTLFLRLKPGDRRAALAMLDE